MNFIIKETQEREELHYEGLATLTEADSDIVWNEDEEAFEISKDGFEWWTRMVELLSTYEDLAWEARKMGINEDDILDITTCIGLEAELWEEAIEDIKNLIADNQ